MVFIQSSSPLWTRLRSATHDAVSLIFFHMNILTTLALFILVFGSRLDDPESLSIGSSFVLELLRKD